MIDFHNHIIPSVDDGPKSIEISIEMLKEAENQGITDVISTVHFQHPKMDGKNTEYSFIRQKCKELQKSIDINKINVRIHIAAEVFYLPNLTRILDNPLVTVGNGKFMLIEFQTKILPPNYISEFFKLTQKGITPIIAHPERYAPIQENIDLCEEWIKRGYVLQADCGSIIGHFGEKCKSTVMELIKRGYIQIIGSDAHNNRIRNFCLKPAHKILEDLFDDEIIKKLKHNSILLLEGKNLEIIKPLNIIDNNSIEERIFNKFIRLIKRRDS